jgi:RimJ/RimL family protein N-acetyltransferase
MKLNGKRVTIRPMKRADVEAMARWRPIVDPLYQPYDLPQQSLSEHMRWFTWRNADPLRRLYAVENERHEVIGSLTLREIDGNRSSRLGITLGADYVSQGYGSEALRLFLDYYFDVMGFQQMVLDVAGTNVRAIRSYLRLGFRQVGYHWRRADHDSYYLLARDPHYQHVRPALRHRGPDLEVLFYDMVLTRDQWRARDG